MAYTTIDDPEAYFQVKLWTGTGSSNALTLDGDTDMQPDLVWIKARSQARNHKMFDSVRGVTKVIGSNETEYETTVATSLTAFGSDGFTVSSDVSVNENTETFVAWCWKASGSTASNTDGSITSTVSANTTAGFSVGTFTKDGDTTVGHGLGSTPSLIIARAKDQSGNWRIWHSSFGADEYMDLDTDGAKATSATIWQDALPTSSVFSMGSLFDSVASYFLSFTEKQGFSKFGKYTGNGNADGTFIYTGFRPAFVIFKRSDSGTENWAIIDSTRSYHNVGNHTLATNSQNAESSFGGGESVGGASNKVDLVSNGIKIRQDSAYNNTSGGTYIYMAFAEQPFVNSNGVPCNAR